MSVLVVDVGTSSVRASIVTPDATVAHTHRRPLLPSTPAPGFVELDAEALAAAVLEVATAALADGGPVDAAGITNQRSTTIVWDRETGVPVGPGIGWQDQRTVMMCLALQGEGLRLSPSSSATKLAFLLDTFDPDRSRDLCFGTVDTWVAWTLSGGAVHVTDLSNAGVTGLMLLDGSGWDNHVLDVLRVPAAVVPPIVDSSGIVGEASALPGAPPIAGLAGDQQASLLGQGCARPGLAKMTFGTGGMLDLCLGPDRPGFEQRGPHGTFPIAAWRLGRHITWGLEAFMLTAGQAVEWLRDDLGVIADAAESEEVAGQCATTGDVWFVPALLGMGTPAWDFGARGTLLGVTGGTGRPEVVRAVLEGVAHRGADLLEAAEADGACTIPSLRVDGGMTANAVFVQALADACQRPVEVSPVIEATTLGAAFLAGMAVGTWGGMDDVAATWSPRTTVEPVTTPDRGRWRQASARAREWVPELSALEF
ncbi:MAG: FGGY family carbohydrate kinase [Actinomycetota bacterium]|nr:FGGY family carbohydrate kinase [Actinomycetota bacterium]